MSLKFFHIIFIIVSILFLLGFAGWVFFAGLDESETGARMLGGLSAVAGLGLIGYLAWFIRKSKRIL